MLLNKSTKIASRQKYIDYFYLKVQRLLLDKVHRVLHDKSIKPKIKYCLDKNTIIISLKSTKIGIYTCL